MELDVEVGGVVRLSAWLAAGQATFTDALVEATEGAIDAAADAVRANTPVRTGRLVGSIGTRVFRTTDGVDGQVYSTAEYARFVEFGTREHGSARRMFARGLDESWPAVEEFYRLAVSAVPPP